MKIIDKVRERKAQILASADEGAKNQNKAVAAIIGGIKSTAWRTYMDQYVDKNDPGAADQLMRLLATDGSAGVEGLDKNRAYLVGNAVCGEGTSLNLDRQVLSIDDALPNVLNCQPTV